MIDKTKIKSRFHIYTGFKKDNNVSRQLQAGEAYLVEDDKKPHYIVKMWAFPRETFYLCQNKEDHGRYTLFAKKIGEENDLTFRRPVGQGYLSRDLRSYLELQFTFPRERVFMSLFPAEITIDSLLLQE